MGNNLHMDFKHLAYLCVCACIGIGTLCTIVASFKSPRPSSILKPFFSRKRSEFSAIALKFRDAAVVFSYLAGVFAIAWYFL
jgi:hypothetical protein